MKHWYTNGIDEKLIEENSQPDNWFRGRSKITIQKQLNTEMNKDPEIRKKEYDRRSKTNRSANHIRTEETKQLMRDKRKAFFDNGGEVWIKGLTKETDQRVAKLAEKSSEGMLKYVTKKKEEDPDFYKRWSDNIEKYRVYNQISCNTSKAENDYYLYLKTLFNEDDIIRWYTGDSRYPFECDFYIKSKDLFIECNFYPSHGSHPFNPNNKEDIDLVKKLKSSDKKWDKMILETWYRRDRYKLKIAKENNLHYITIYNPKEQLNSFTTQ